MEHKYFVDVVGMSRAARQTVSKHLEDITQSCRVLNVDVRHAIAGRVHRFGSDAQIRESGVGRIPLILPRPRARLKGRFRACLVTLNQLINGRGIERSFEVRN
jgi:hypothetical protein